MASLIWLVRIDRLHHTDIKHVVPPWSMYRTHVSHGLTYARIWVSACGFDPAVLSRDNLVKHHARSDLSTLDLKLALQHMIHGKSLLSHGGTLRMDLDFSLLQIQVDFIARKCERTRKTLLCKVRLDFRRSDG